MRSWQANLVGVGAAAAVVGGGLFVGAPPAAANGPSNAMRLMAPPMAGHGVGEIPLSEGLELWGQPARVNMFWTQDSTSEVVRTYVDAWKAAGFDPMVKKADRATEVAMIEKKTGLMRSVTIIDSGDDRMVMPGLTDTRIAPDVTSRNAPVPVPENAHLYLANVADDGQVVSYNATFLLPMRPERAIEFYQVEMKKLHYTVRDDPDMKHLKGGASIEFQRGLELVQVVATRPDAGRMEGQLRSGGLPKDLKLAETSMVMVTHTRALTQESEGSKP